jgi:hypothetical protein
MKMSVVLLNPAAARTALLCREIPQISLLSGLAYYSSRQLKDL